MASKTFAATVADETVPTGFMPVLIMPGMTTLTPIGACSDTELGAQDVGEPEHPVLGDGVGPEAAQRQDGRHGGRVDDMPLFLRGQDARHEGADAVDDAPQVDVDDAVPVLERYLPGVAAVDDAGIVHRDVELPEVLDGRGPDALDGVGISDVGGDGQDLGALAGQSRRVRAQGVLVDVGHDDLHAGGDEAFDDGQPDATGRAGDDGGPSFQLLHGQSIVSEGVRRPPSSVPTRGPSAMMVAMTGRHG